MKLTVRKEKRPKGLMGIAWVDRGGLELFGNGEYIGGVCKLLYESGRTRWYWYGAGRNSYSEAITYETRDEAMAALKLHVKKVVEDAKR